MKKMILFLIFVLIEGFSFCEELASKYNCYTCYYAKDNNAKFYSEPNKKGLIFGQLSKGEEIYINEKISSTDWFFCYCPKFNKIGYCEAEYFEYKPFFWEMIDGILEGDVTILNKIENGYVKTVYLDYLIKEYLMDKNEDDCLKVIKLAYDSGSREQTFDSTVLIEAARLNYNSVLEFLLEKEEYRKEINIKRNQYAQPLFFSLWQGNEEMVELLLQNGADPNLVTAYSYTMFESIDSAVENHQISKAKAESLKILLLQYGYIESNSK